MKANRASATAVHRAGNMMPSPSRRIGGNWRVSDRSPSPLQILLVQHHVHALVAVHHLGDAQVGGEACQHIGVRAGQPGAALEGGEDQGGRQPPRNAGGGVGAGAHPTPCAPRPVSRKRPTKPVSIALMQTSPSPCTAWPSPAENSAPSVKIGRESVVPATSSLF